MSKNRITYNKLIRDRIPEIISQSGKKASIEKLNEENFVKMLNEKLGEELEEYYQSQSIEELADLVEVISSLLEAKGISFEAFEKIREEKREERGGFEKRLLLKWVE